MKHLQLRQTPEHYEGTESTISPRPTRIALVGCGAVTALRHLPALARRTDCHLAALVDANKSRAEQLAADFGAPHILTEYHDLLSLGVDVAIVALPNYLHAPVSLELIKAGIHVLVEKPMALSAAECDAMVQAADARQVVLAVGLMRRFLHAGRFAKWAIDSGLLGHIVSFDIRDGAVFDWPLTSDFFFHAKMAGGGVLIDTGVHTLDQLLWWLGDVKSFEYYDDYYGGVEADCELHITLQSGAHGIVELSRTRNLRNTAIIRGERAELEVHLSRNALSLHFLDSPMQLIGQGAPWESTTTAQSQVDIIAAEHDDMLQAIRTGRHLEVSGVEGRRSAALIEACYRERRPLQLPWVVTQPSPVMERSR